MKNGGWRKGVRVWLSICLVFLGALALGSERVWATGGPPGEKVLHMAASDFGYPSPFTFVPRGPGWTRTNLIFDTLTWKDDQGIVPLLAKEWTISPDGKTYIFTLNDKARWHDGKPVTAEDVAFTYDYFRKHPIPWFSGVLNEIDQVKAVASQKVEFVLKAPYAPFLTNIAGNVMILPKHIWEKVEEPKTFTGKEAVVGSGPFKLNAYSKEQKTLDFQANPDYFLGRPVIDRLLIVPPGEFIMKLEKGDVDAGGMIPDPEVKILKTKPQFKYLADKGVWVLRLYFNQEAHPLFKEKAFRQALYYGLNRVELTQRVVGDVAEPAGPELLPPQSPWFAAAPERYAYSPQKAASLLEGLGCRDTDGDGIREYQGQPLKLELLLSHDEAREGELIKHDWKPLGIAVNVKAVDGNTRDAMMVEGKFQMALNGHGQVTSDPVLFNRYFAPKQSQGSGSAITRNDWQHPEFWQLAQEQKSMVNMDERKAKVARMQSILADELPTLPLYYKHSFLFYNPRRFEGWFFSPGMLGNGVPTEMNKLIFLRGTYQPDSGANSGGQTDRPLPSRGGSPLLWAGVLILFIAGGVWWWNRQKAR